jgi:predicted GTPase
MTCPFFLSLYLEKTRIFKAIELALEVYENRQRKVPTAKLNEAMLAADCGLSCACGKRKFNKN